MHTQMKDMTTRNVIAQKNKHINFIVIVLSGLIYMFT